MKAKKTVEYQLECIENGKWGKSMFSPESKTLSDATDAYRLVIGYGGKEVYRIVKTTTTTTTEVLPTTKKAKRK